MPISSPPISDKHHQYHAADERARFPLSKPEAPQPALSPNFQKLKSKDPDHPASTMQLQALAACLAVLATLVAAAPLRPMGTLDMRATADPELLSDGYDHSYKPSKRAETADPTPLSDGYDHGYHPSKRAETADPELLSDGYDH
ncbi:hypothetical protein MMC11_006266, partial [Xylographa trunciseda]|nr:hypothetical protein [Xylographa trunciseda]